MGSEGGLVLGRRALYLGAKSIDFADLLGVAYRLSGRDAKVAITIEPAARC